MYIQELKKSDLVNINGGFVCAGLCIAGAIAAGFVVGAAVTIGIAVLTKPDEPAE